MHVTAASLSLPHDQTEKGHIGNISLRCKNALRKKLMPLILLPPYQKHTFQFPRQPYGLSGLGCLEDRSEGCGLKELPFLTPLVLGIFGKKNMKGLMVKESAKPQRVIALGYCFKGRWGNCIGLGPSTMSPRRTWSCQLQNNSFKERLPGLSLK